MNGAFVSVPYNISDLQIYRNRTYIVIKLDNEFNVQYEGANSVLACVNQRYAGRMTGMCGNFDGNCTNDLVTRNGIAVEDKWYGWNAVGDSWRIIDEEFPQ